MNDIKKIEYCYPEIIKNAPNNTPVKRVDDVGATKNPILTWDMI